MDNVYYNPLGDDYSHSLTVGPRFHQNLDPDDDRINVSPLFQIDTVYSFDAPCVWTVKTFNQWEYDSIQAIPLNGGEPKYVRPSWVFYPMLTTFKPEIIYSKDRKYGKLSLTMQEPNKYLEPCQIVVTIEDISGAGFEMQVTTSLITYYLTYDLSQRHRHRLSVT